ncbi:hypothetical protein DYB36_001014 [Aphanomyces astaci]|uniref:ABC transmembrane type-1 domain-containing protein n=2 Tax=Aphanomyces astaci TaxID=112090 RepID=A0A397A6T4_APHAT|nr:hypothetical protein DYB36_001014 [Aphanomyces astaci]
MNLGNQRQLESSDLWPLQQENQCDFVSRQFEPRYHAAKPIVKASLSMFGPRALFIGLTRLVVMVASLYAPVVLQQVVSVIKTQSDLQNEVMYVQVASALQYLLFKKTMVLNAKSRKLKSTGEISNLFTSDMWQVLGVPIIVNDIWIIPLQVATLLFMLWQLLGWAMVTGIVVVGVAFIVNRYLATATRNNGKKLMEKKDIRMKVVNEVFGSMQIKLNAWEERYYVKISDFRDDELKSLWMGSCIQAGTIAMNYIAPVALTTVSFASYVLLFKQTLTASKVFTALALFNMIKAPMMLLPEIIAIWMQSLVLYKPQPCRSSNAMAIEVVDGCFGWDADKPFFNHLNVSVKGGELVVLHGSVGEGKSSFCNVLLGELDKYGGSVGVSGRVAFFAQQPWIQNLTIRENILFGLPYDRVKYNNVLEACALAKDLTLFAAGDRTEIGSKGVIVSGGQKARISQARAYYSDADIFILDSPLSAVDAIVQNEIFTKCMLGLLRHKTILLVTHSPEIIGSPYVDRTIEIKDGALVETVNVAKIGLDKSPISPLKARQYFTDDSSEDLLEDGVAVTTVHYQDMMLVSPSVKSPFGGHLEQYCLFTPIDDSQPKTYNETSGKLVVVEEREAGRVSSEVFLAYFNAVGGWSVVIALLVVQSAWQGLQVTSDLWLSSWTSTGSTTTSEEFLDSAQYNILIYTLLAVSSSVMVVFRSLMVSGLCLSKARELVRLSKTTRSTMTHISESIDGAVLMRAFGPKQVRRFERLHQVKVDRNNETNFCSDLAGQWFAFRIQMISASIL